MSTKEINTVADDVAARLAALSPEQRALLIARYRKNGARPTADRITPRVQRSAYAPVSFAQQRLYFLNLYDPASSFYNIPMALRLEGPLDASALEQSLSEIQRRHEILRSVFLTLDRLPIQCALPAQPLRVSRIDLRETTRAAGAAEAVINAEARRPFDLARGPLFRATLLRLGDTEHILLLTMHHIVFDGWSLGILCRELTTLYNSFAQGRASTLPEPALQYSDFAYWQRQGARGAVLEKQLDYWVEHLEGAPAVLSLPTDRPRPSVASFNGSQLSARLSGPVADGLAALARQEQTTLFIILLAAFQTLLHRYSNQDDICVGTVTTGRDRPEIQEMIGLFVNTLVIRAKLTGRTTFRELVASLRRTVRDAFANQEAPFDQVVDTLECARDPSYTPLFQAMFVMQQFQDSEMAFDGLKLTPVGLREETTKFDLTLAAAPGRDGLGCTFQYNTELFDASTISRMLEHFHILLQGIVADRDSRLADLPLLSETELQQLEEWSVA